MPESYKYMPTEQILTIDNIIDLPMQELLKQEMLVDLFPWFFRNSLSSNTSIGNKEYEKPTGFAHVFKNETGIVTKFYDTVFPIVENTCSRIGHKFNDILYGRAFLQLPLKNKEGLTNPHIDLPEIEHYVFLYYVKDADGDTVIFDKTHKGGVENTDFNDLEITQRIRPKQGTVLVFNGWRYHANILPENDIRCIINFNVT